MKRYRFLKVVRVLGIVALAVTVFGFVTEQLWNRILPGVFGMKTINFGQAIGLLVLSKLLFGGFHRHSGGRWRRTLQERWAQMSPEERERFRLGMRGRCGNRGEPREGVAAEQPSA